MANVHNSVKLCLRCDLYVAADEFETCFRCGCRNEYCPECGVPTLDPDRKGCSTACAAKINAEVAEELAEATCQQS